MDFWVISSVLALWCFFLFDFATTLTFSQQFRYHGLFLLGIKVIPLILISFYISRMVANV